MRTALMNTVAGTGTTTTGSADDYFDRSSRFSRNALSFCAGLFALMMVAAPASAATLKIATLSPDDRYGWVRGSMAKREKTHRWQREDEVHGRR